MTRIPMSANVVAQASAIIEEELGEFRPFAGLPASELETMAARLARALAPLLLPAATGEAQRDAA